MYVDDLALIASSPEDLQSMIDIVAQYATKWRYCLNPHKSKVLVFGSRITPSTTWTMKGEKLDVMKEYLHLGILRSTFPSTGPCDKSTWDNPPFLPSTVLGLGLGVSIRSQPCGCIPPLPSLECCMELKSGALLTQSSKCLREPIGKFSEQSKDSLSDVLRRALAHFLVAPPFQTLLPTRNSRS